MIGNNKKNGLPAGRQGFTLMELLVAMVVFVLAITVAISLLTSALRAQRKSIGLLNVQENTRYLMGFITKEIRMSQIKEADGQISSLDITHPINGDITYAFSGTQLTRNGEPISSDEVEVGGIFLVDGKTFEDNEQPRVTIIMKVRSAGTKTEEQTEINIQTTICQRELD